MTFLKVRTAVWIASVVFLAAIPALGQNTPCGPRAVADSADALQRCLQDALAVARRGDERRLSVLVKEMEIPNYREWFTATYGRAGSLFADAYAVKLSEQDMARVHMLEATARNMKRSRTKTVLIRKVNDAPDEGDPFETNAIKNLQRPVNLFAAYYSGSHAPNRNIIGYFVYVDGRFRWQSGFVEDAVTHRIIVDTGH